MVDNFPQTLAGWNYQHGNLLIKTLQKFYMNYEQRIKQPVAILA